MPIQTTEELEASILAAKVAAGINYELLVFEASEKTSGKDDGETFAFRRPTSSEWQRFRSERISDNTLTQVVALKTLCLACRIYPSMSEFAQALEARPGLVEAISNDLIVYAGAEKAKKVRRL